MEGKILLVDDEKRIADILKYNLSEAGFTVDCSYDGKSPRNGGRVLAGFNYP